MKISDLIAAQYQKYYEARLSGQRLRKAGAGYSCRCVFHDDRSPSLSVNFNKGIWNCHAGTGCGSGGVLDFEMKFSKTDKDTALANIADILGLAQGALSPGQKWEARYKYTDEYDHLLFEVIRYPKDSVTGKKRIVQRRPLENGEWEWNTEKCRKVLYRLPSVIIAREIICVEGEKCADLLNEEVQVLESVAATTSPGGAGKWRDEYAPFLTGKKIIILCDNDEPGRKHALAIAGSVVRFALAVKIVELPGLAVGEDVYEYLKKYNHTFLELLEVINATDWWRPPEATHSIFVNVIDFTRDAPSEIDWIVEGVIQKGANGITVADPKAGKSVIMADLAVALAAGQSWMPGLGSGGFFVPRPIRVGFCAREDTPNLTQWRLKHIATARQIDLREIRDNLWINSKREAPRLMIDEPDDMKELMLELEKKKIEFLILDVFRRLHSADENDPNEMQKIIDSVCLIQERTGCQIALVHHKRKSSGERQYGPASLTGSARGSSVIAGYAEFIMGVEVVNPQAPKHEWVRQLEVELKAAIAPENWHCRFVDQSSPVVGISVERVQWEPPKRGKKKADKLAGEQEQPPLYPTEPESGDVPF